MTITKDRAVGALVAENYRAAEVFRKHKIDFCCKGNLTIEEVSRNKKISVDELLGDLEKITTNAGSENTDYRTWPVDVLADYIEVKHHRYVREKTPVLLQYLAKLSRVHGDAHPELRQIEEHFADSARALAAHMRKEELVLFPFIKRMMREGAAAMPAHFGTLGNPIEMMKEEHTMEGERFGFISRLSGNYTPPADACNTYRVTYAMLQEFENDLHQHIHLENNILFVNALAKEQELFPRS
jgi:regulator of cell morphogenesis and NO signaling